MQVVLTDYLPAILTNLRACVHLNAAAGSSPPAACPGGGAAAGGALAPTSERQRDASGSAGDSGSGGSDSGTGEAAAPGQEEGRGQEQGQGKEEELLFDPEDASECSDLDDFFAEAAAGAQRQGQRGQQQQQLPESWDTVSPCLALHIAIHCTPQ
jgi:hypothetical protein